MGTRRTLFTRCSLGKVREGSAPEQIATNRSYLTFLLCSLSRSTGCIGTHYFPVPTHTVQTNICASTLSHTTLLQYVSTIVVALSSQRCESSQAEPSRAKPSRVNPSIESLPKRRNTIGLPEQHNTFVQSETAMYPCLSQTRGQSVKAESSWLNDTANHRSRSTV